MHAKHPLALSCAIHFIAVQFGSHIAVVFVRAYRLLSHDFLQQGLRPHSAVLMGKNTLMKRCIRLYNERTGSDTWAPLLDALVGNVGLVFTKGDLSEASSTTLSPAQKNSS